jgi:signal transduction histidine kinase
VRITVVQRAETVTVAVADVGSGIAANEVEHVFDPFRRTGASKETIPGVGLGLFVARKVVEAHRGTITVESREGVGSTFMLHLPLGNRDGGLADRR